MTMTLLASFNGFEARADDDDEEELSERRADFEFSNDRNLFSSEDTKRERELIDAVRSSFIVPLCVFGREDGVPPTETVYLKDVARVQEFMQLYKTNCKKRGI